MPKTINWIEDFKKEVISEKVDSIKLAIRPGRLYYDTQYYKKGDIVDIRIDNEVIRKALIDEDLAISKIKDIPQPKLNLLKKSLQSHKNIIDFLSKRYNLCLNENSEVTLITYRNLDLLDAAENEDPHFC